MKSKHLTVRLSQRGFRESDVALIMKIGTEVRGEGYYVRQRDADQHVAALRAEAERVERLTNTFLVYKNGVIITIYRPERAGKRRFISQLLD